MSQNKKVLILCLTAIPILFSACGRLEVQKSASLEEPSMTSDPLYSSSTTLASADLVVRSMAAELFPMDLRLNADFKISSSQVLSLPEGAVFDFKTRHLLWIPKTGQAGEHVAQIQFFGESGETAIVEARITVNTTPLTAGPPATYRDGDVGYIFIHGKTDENLCHDSTGLKRYWRHGDDVIAPDKENRLLACYDGRQDVVSESKKVAQQILNAKCGRFNRCIVVAHSMGGLMIEHILTHTRNPVATDRYPEWFSERRDLFQKVKDRTLMVVSLASAAGGSKVADIVINPSRQNISNQAIGIVARAFGEKNDAAKNLVPDFSSTYVAPMNEDPEVPFFMVAGFSKKILKGTYDYAKAITGNLFFDKHGDKKKYFNGDIDYMRLDRIAEFGSRSDGLVSFRSACGVRSRSDANGPGYDDSMQSQLDYCFKAPKKPNHYPWFTINLNHSLITGPTSACHYTANTCDPQFPQGPRAGFRGLSAAETVRRLLTGSLTSGDAEALTMPSVFRLDFYRAYNPDLARLSNERLIEHWISHGIAEGRRASPDFDIEFYRAFYPDLSQLRSRDLLWHFNRYGIAEGRWGAAELDPQIFDAAFYRSSYSDLQLFTDYQLKKHWVLYGYAEGRKGSP